VTVLVCLPPAVARFAKARGYVPRGDSCPEGVVPIGKRVLGVPGDTICVTVAGLRVNGTPVPNSQALRFDHRGRPLPRLVMGCSVVAPAHLWVVSSYSRASFDSRYFGAIASGDVCSSARVLWTWGAPEGLSGPRHPPVSHSAIRGLTQWNVISSDLART
jgi:conjugative transfer signal peptidase TraF